MVLVKICGITSIKDAKIAQEAGADAVGFVFAKSPRQVSLKKAQAISKALPSSIKKVGVFVNAPAGFVKKAKKAAGLDAFQFHGEESPEYCKKFRKIAAVIKAIKVKDKSSLENIKYYDVDAVLLDAYSAKAKGGTGKSFNWDLAIQAKKFKKPVILSGGLSAFNVRKAIRKVKPYAVDVSSGVEISPGRKSEKKVRQFIRNVKKA